MTLGYDKKLFILAFDHRGSFQKKMFGISGVPDASEIARITDAKSVIFEGFSLALSEGAPAGEAGMLVDEQFGAGVARTAKSNGWTLAMPVEKSGLDWFDFEYGDDFGAHIEKFDPTFSKILVRWNADGNAEQNAKSVAGLKTLSEWLHTNGRKFLCELLVPAEPAQLAAVGGDAERYDVEVRPGLMKLAVEAFQDAGIEPDVWKIEGIDRREDCEMLAEAVRRNGRDNVACVVLGRGANADKVDHWLRTGSGVAGYIGFAIGRTIWWDQLKGFLDGSLTRDDAAKQISANYRRSIDVYNGG